MVLGFLCRSATPLPFLQLLISRVEFEILVPCNTRPDTSVTIKILNTFSEYIRRQFFNFFLPRFSGLCVLFLLVNTGQHHQQLVQLPYFAFSVHGAHSTHPFPQYL
ncbi:hypothetical protein RJT34_20278 [Clitoria ternatea]|uniref:Uncharacterized protein n=1 Tax=Clitoria ternatea TaxID=43366 RepID=A0AAN9ISK1_CLITE